MSDKTLSGTFRSGLIDAVLSGFNGLTNGAYIIDTLPISPPPQKVWTIKTFTIIAQMILLPNPDGLNDPPYGKLGKIIGGIAPNVPPTSNAPYDPNKGVAPSYLNGQFTPPDLSLAGTMFDPASDSLPPMADAGTYGPANYPTYKLIATTVNPPVPIAATSGIFGVFIVMQPSLTNNLNIGLNVGSIADTWSAPSWSISYDDDTTLT
jgi:hypothetical protein